MTVIDVGHTPCVVNAVRTGDNGELLFNAHLAKNTDYLVAKSESGVVVAVPRSEVPEREWDLWEDSELRAALWRGFDDACAGRTESLDKVLESLGLTEE